MSYHKAATPKFPHILHGGDYNPEQWLNYPDVLSEDIRLMKLANINCVSLGMLEESRAKVSDAVSSALDFRTNKNEPKGT